MVGTVKLDDRQHEHVRFAARLFGVTEAEVVARAVRHYAREVPAPGRPGDDPAVPVHVYGEYEGRRVEGTYLPATRRLTVTGEPLPGREFTTPSGAAKAVVAALNPARSGAPQTNGWRFWHLAETGERLEVLR